MGKWNKRQQKLFKDTYDRCVINFANDVCDWGRLQVDVMHQTDLKTFDTDQDFIDFAKESFLHSVKIYHEEHYEKEAAIQATRSIIKYGS
jgi:hypothetical protein